MVWSTFAICHCCDFISFFLLSIFFLKFLIFAKKITVSSKKKEFGAVWKISLVLLMDDIAMIFFEALLRSQLWWWLSPAPFAGCFTFFLSDRCFLYLFRALFWVSSVFSLMFSTIEKKINKSEEQFLLPIEFSRKFQVILKWNERYYRRTLHQRAGPERCLSQCVFMSDM